jgi:exopolyphosphatase/guanosine-5'-triphosphate,3'-diphosphate pyrophosphatase
LPKKRHESWQLIVDRQQRRTVAAMALLLRLAASLDRRPAAVIGTIRVMTKQVSAAKQALTDLEISLEPVDTQVGDQPVDLSLERWSLAACRDVVLEACGLSLKVLGS